MYLHFETMFSKPCIVFAVWLRQKQFSLGFISLYLNDCTIMFNLNIKYLFIKTYISAVNYGIYIVHTGFTILDYDTNMFVEF